LTHLSGEERRRYVRRMFARIAPRYDLLNRLMTFGRDVRWRREAVRRLEIGAKAVLLDVGAGTGDIAIQIVRQKTNAFVVACDLTPEMIAVGRGRSLSEQVMWVVADAAHLPFSPGVFSGVISGFLLRNVPDVDQALREQQRVLVQGGRFVSLDTTPPPTGFLGSFIRFYLNIVIPLLGKLITGEADAYAYLPDSTNKFLRAEELEMRIQAAGIQGVKFVRRMLGTMAIHWGEKPGEISAGDPTLA
jgi:demethylmenaquinone methyltransferase/2-methoxy-6-polyprenyl-1,4-benzoquinol methylase